MNKVYYLIILILFVSCQMGKHEDANEKRKADSIQSEAILREHINWAIWEQYVEDSTRQSMMKDTLQDSI